MGDDSPKLPADGERGLTAGEIALLKPIYGTSVDYGQVRIHNGRTSLASKAQDLAGKFLPGSFKAAAQVSGSRITYDSPAYSDDFSKGDTHMFVHEMAHVWQNQNKVGGDLKTAEDFVAEGFNYSKVYNYTPDPTKDLKDYNREQQADMIADYFGYRQHLAHPEPSPLSKTPEDAEKGFFGQMMLRKLSDLHRTHPEDPKFKEFTDAKYVGFDKEGNAHFTQKFVDKMHSDQEKNEMEYRQRMDAVVKVLHNFIQDPAYLNPDRPRPAAPKPEPAARPQ